MSHQKKIVVCLLLLALTNMLVHFFVGSCNQEFQPRSALRTTTSSIASIHKVMLGTPFEKEGKYVLVAGAAGYIGSHMSMLLLEHGYKVVGVDNLSRGSQIAIDALKVFEKFEFHKIELTDEEAVKNLFTAYGFGAVFHFADFAFVRESVERPDMYLGITFSKVYNLVNVMIDHNVSPLLYSSSCAVFGAPTDFPVTTESRTIPISPYGMAKLNAESYIRSKVSATFQAHAFRYFNVIGADHKTRLGENPSPEFARFGRLWTAITEAAKGQRPCFTLHDTNLPGTVDGSAERDYIHVEDIASSHLFVWEKSLANSKMNPFNVWNVATGHPYSTLQFFETAKNVTGVQIPVCYGGNAPSDFEAPKIYGSAEKLRALGWKPKYDALDEMLKSAWRWEEKKLAALPLSAPKPRKNNEYDICVVGAGLSGAVIAERYANVGNKTVLLMEKRNHVGGNCYDYIDEETGIRVNLHGVHLFRTDSTRVWKYVQQFSDWTPWEHRVVAKVGDQFVPVPVNIDSVNALFGLNISSDDEMKAWLIQEQIVSEDQNYTNSEEIALSQVGWRLYDSIFKPYTIKQWNMTLSSLGPSVMARTAVRSNHDDRFFTDVYQVYPTHGYTRIFENMLRSPKITVRLETDYFQEREKLNCGHTYFTGHIDAYFAAQSMPKLEYRSLRFERKVYKDTEYFQPRSQVDYPSLDYNYTRIVEYKHFLHQKSSDTVVFFEYSTDVGEPYHPIRNQENLDLYAKYQKLAMQEKDVSFIGRLANYEYFNMDQAILNALEMFDEHTQPCKQGVFESVKQWKSLFPPGAFQFQEKVLMSIPIHTKSATSVDELIKNLSTKNYDFYLFALDDHNWTAYEWYDNVTIDYQVPGMTIGWGLAKRFLTPQAVHPYSHICYWNDDLEPTEDFDGDIFIQWLQGLHLEVVQPQISENAYSYEGTDTLHRPNSSQLPGIHVAEVMAPCYSRKVWSTCIWRYLNPTFSNGWGVNISLHQASCAPTWSHSVRLPIDHKGRQSVHNFDNLEIPHREFAAYYAIAEMKGWVDGMPKKGSKPRSYQIAVDGLCQLYLDVQPLH